MQSPLNAHSVAIPPELLYCSKIAPAVRDTWAQLRGLADENGKLEIKGGIQVLAGITSKSTATLYGHLAALRDMQALKWSASHAGELVVTFDDKGFYSYLSKILNTSLINSLSINSVDSRKDLKNGVSKILESKRDPLLEHPAVKTYRAVVHLTANETQRAAIVKVVGYDTEGWKFCLEHWRGHGWSPTNVTGMLESYQKGGVEACTLCRRKNGSKPAAAPAHKGAKEILQELREEEQRKNGN